MEEICIIVQTGFFNRDNELISIKLVGVDNMKDYVNDFFKEYKFK